MGGFLRNGTWIHDDEWTTNKDGSFQREPTKFHDRAQRDSSARFTVEPGRYHLFVSLACPWAHRSLLIRALKGLESAIPISVTNPVMGRDGWSFGAQADRPEPEPLLGKRFLREIYLEADPEFSGRATVPVLWDTKEHTIVNNESRQILRMLDVDFHALARRKVCLYPNHLAKDVDRTIDAIYAPINNGVYRAGFANTQHAYEEAFDDLFAALNHYDQLLEGQRYLCGEQLTEADLCLFTTLIRFDPVYYVHFKCNQRRLADYRNLGGYVRELYQLPHVAAVCDFNHIKQHYYRSHPAINPKALVPRGPDLSWLKQPHGRGHLAGGPPAELYPPSKAWGVPTLH